MNILKFTLIAALLVSTTAGATGLPAPDFSKWASKTLQDNGIAGAKVVETSYPFSFTYCQKDSQTLWRYTVMSPEQLEAIGKGKTVTPITQKTVAEENDSDSCKVAS